MAKCQGSSPGDVIYHFLAHFSSTIPDFARSPTQTSPTPVNSFPTVSNYQRVGRIVSAVDELPISDRICHNPTYLVLPIAIPCLNILPNFSLGIDLAGLGVHSAHQQQLSGS